MPTYDYSCTSCGEESTFLVPYVDREKEQVCNHCGSAAKYKFPCPPIRTSDSASFVDGTSRGWENIKEANKIKREALNLPDSKRGKHKEEIKKLGGDPTFK